MQKVIDAQAKLLSRVTPMKRILCLCPVAGIPSDSKIVVDIGMAVSDPYLAHAISIPASSIPTIDKLTAGKEMSSSVYSFRSLSNIREESWLQSTAVRPGQFWDRFCGHSDIGAVAFALPMINNARTNFDDEAVRQIREELRFIIEDSYASCVGNEYHSHDEVSKKLFLQCEIDDRLTEQEAAQKAEEEPAMWDEIEDILVNEGNFLDPSTHASVALNEFLWRHTGGWPNTFG